MRRVSRLALGLLVLWGALCARSAHAIPAFARREGVPCQMCHFRLPELNADGRAYLYRGLREAPGEGAAPAAAARPLGDATPLQWSNYLSLMGTHDLTLARGTRPAFNSGVIDLLVGGPLDSHLSAFANPSFDIEAGGSSVDQAYAHAITRWAPRFGSGRAGNLLPFAVLLNGGGPQMSISTPLVLGLPGPGGSGWSPTTLVRGAEVGLLDVARWNAFVGAGQPHLGVEGIPGFERHTDLYASAEYLFGSQGDSLTLFGYSGTAWLGPGATSQRFHRVGAFANFYLPQTKILAGYLAGKERDAAGRSLNTTGFFAQAEYLFAPQWAGYARYDWLRQDLPGGRQRFSGPTLGVSWWAQTQVRLALEGQLISVTGQPQARSLTGELLWVY